MSENKPNKRLISEKEMLDYLDGRVKGPEANQIERQLLDSSFEEDALEGYSSLQSSEIKKDLQNLKEKLESRNNYRKPGYLSIAATVAFLMTAFGSIWFVMENALPNSEITLKQDLETTANEPTLVEAQSDTTTQEIAMISESSIEETADQESESDIGQVAAEADPESIDASSEEVIEDDPEQPADESLLALNDDTGEGAPEPAIVSTAEPELVAEEAIAVSFDETVSEPIQANEVESTRSSKLLAAPSRQIETNVLTGAVFYQEDGEPLQGVTVSFGEQNTNTDLSGRFQLSNVSANSDQTLDFSLTNLTSKSVSIENLEDINIVMSPAPSFNQKAFILVYEDSNNRSPRPAEGVTAFTEYVNSSLSYPEAAKSAQIEGVVLLKLTISSDGNINNIEVKKSLSNDCDQEAVRLIEEGPQWSPATYNGEPVEGSVRVRFIFEI